MNVAMTMTVNGLIRTLRATAHDLAEAVERGYASRDGLPIPGQPARRETDRTAKGDDDERAGR